MIESITVQFTYMKNFFNRAYYGTTMVGMDTTSLERALKTDIEHLQKIQAVVAELNAEPDANIEQTIVKHIPRGLIIKNRTGHRTYSVPCLTVHELLK